MLVSVIIALTACNLAADDRIDLRDGKSVSGRIQQESATEVAIQSAGNVQTVPVNRIAQIHYEGQPAVLTHAKAMEAAYQLNQAADDYAKAQAELKDKPVILQAARFGEARVRARLALDESARIDEAIGLLAALDRDLPASRHHFLAQELLGQLYLQKDDYTKAAACFEELARAPWLEATLLAARYQAQSLRAQKKLDEAVRQIDAALQAKTETREQESIACEVLLEKAHCLRDQDRRALEAETLSQVIDRAPISATLISAEAYSALGDCYRADHKPWEAVWAFLHVQTLFARHEELHARALYNLSQLWSELGRQDRAAAALSSLKAEHPKSPWAKKVGS